MIPFCHFTSKIINFERKNNGHASSIDNFPSKQPSADNFAIASAKDSQNLRSLRADLAQPTNPIPDPSVKLRSSGLNLGFSLYRGITLKPPDPSPFMKGESRVSWKPRGDDTRSSTAKEEFPFRNSSKRVEGSWLLIVVFWYMTKLSPLALVYRKISLCIMWRAPAISLRKHW